MEEDNIKIELNMNEVFDLLPESYTKLPLAAITDKYFGYEAYQIEINEIHSRHSEEEAHEFLSVAIRYDEDMQAVEKAAKEARRYHEEGERKKSDLYKKIADKVKSLSALEMQELLSYEEKNGLEHAIRI